MPEFGGCSLCGAEAPLVLGSCVDRARCTQRIRSEANRLRRAIEDHKADIEAAGTVRLADDASRTTARRKAEADARLWAAVE